MVHFRLPGYLKSAGILLFLFLPAVAANANRGMPNEFRAKVGVF